LYLTNQEEKMAKGECGEAVMFSMKILVAVGEACGADRLVEVSRCHVMTSMAPDIQHARIDLLEKFASAGGKYIVPTTVDPASLDLEHWREFKTPSDYYRSAMKLLQLNRRLGAIPNYSCIPYEQGLAPSFGEMVSFTESSYVAFANSVIGARANREPQGIAVSAGITGKAPLYGLRLKENRHGDVHVKLKGLDSSSFDDSDYAVLGYHLGANLGHEIPVIDGIKPGMTIDQLKVLGASVACKGSVAMYHIVGISPEARSRQEAFGGEKPKDVLEVDANALKRTREEISTVSGGKIDAVLVGCPHYSVFQIGKLAHQLEGKKVSTNVKFFLYTCQEAKALGEQMGYIKTIEKAGAHVSVGTCMTLSPMKYWGFKTIMTDSPKCAYTCPVDIGANVIFGTIDQCVRAAVRGIA
jgi:predicted aconitase